MSEREEKQIDATIAKLIAETARINAEAQKISVEARWYPYVAVAGIFGAALAFIKIIEAL